MDAVGPAYGALIAAAIVCDLYQQNKPDAARVAIAEVARRVKAFERDAKSDTDKNLLYRATGRTSYCLSSEEEKLGRYEQAVEAAESAERDVRKVSMITFNDGNWPRFDRAT